MRRATLTLVLLALSVPALAAVEGSISGLVRDPGGEPLPGVTVEVRGPVLLGARSTLTRADGSFVVRGLPPGPGYVATFTLAGFESTATPELTVNLAQDSQVRVEMRLAALRAEVVVTATAPLVDVTQTATGQPFTAEHLRELSVGARSRTFQNVLSQAPGVSGQVFAEGVEYQDVLGGSMFANAYLVDGVNSTDPTDHMQGQFLNVDAVQEVSLQTSGALPELGRGSGGVISVVTRSGGNELHGSLDLRWHSSELAETGDHYDPDHEPFRSTPWSATLGGPFSKDALWFFVNLARVDETSTPWTSDPVVLAQVREPAPRRGTGWLGSAKLSARAGERWTGFVSYADYSNRASNTYSQANVQPEATTLGRNRAGLLSGVASGLLSDDWFVELSAGLARSRYEYGPDGVDLDVPVWVNNAGNGVWYDNNFFHWLTDRSRAQVALASTLFLTSLAGNHELKVGVEGDRTRYSDLMVKTGAPSDPAFCSPDPGVRGAPVGASCGAYFFFDGFDATGARVPYRQRLEERQPELTRRGRSLALYLQDRWRPTPRLTVNAGLRWDRNEYFNNQDVNVANLAMLQPRLGASFDLTGDGRTAARASWGFFYLDAPLSLMRAANTGLTPPYGATYEWSAASGTWELVPDSETGGVGAGVVDTPPVDGSLDPTYDEQVNVALERELADQLSVTVTWVYKKAHDLFDTTCSDYDTCPFLWLSNWPGRSLGLSNPLRRSYSGWMLDASWRVPDGRGLVLASYVYSEARGSLELWERAGQSPDFDYYPYHFDNRDGYLGFDARHRVKLQASYRVPVVETSVSVAYSYSSPMAQLMESTPWDYDPFESWPGEYLAPRGSMRVPARHVLDLQLEKPFALDPVARGLEVSAFLTVYNLLGSETATVLDTWVQSSNFGQPTAYARPRSFELGVRLEF